VVRAHLTQAETDLVLVVSDVIYQGIVKHRYGVIDPARFQPVWISVKETSSRAWLHTPGTDQGTAPVPAAAIHRLTAALPAGLPALPARVPPDRPTPGITRLAGRQLPGTLQIPARAYVENYQPGGLLASAHSPRRIHVGVRERLKRQAERLEDHPASCRPRSGAGRRRMV
jgi:hypothetical protein